MEFTRSASVS